MLTPQILNFRHITLTPTSYVSRPFLLNIPIIHSWCHIFTIPPLLSCPHFPAYLAEVSRLSLQPCPSSWGQSDSLGKTTTLVKSNSPTLCPHSCSVTWPKKNIQSYLVVSLDSLSLTLSSPSFCLAIKSMFPRSVRSPILLVQSTPLPPISSI